MPSHPARQECRHRRQNEQDIGGDLRRHHGLDLRHRQYRGQPAAAAAASR
jgi:hypothetical protein